MTRESEGDKADMWLLRFVAMPFFLVMFLVPVVLPAPLWAEESRFLSVLNDIPLMPGLYELTEEMVVFDKPEGRIVETSAVSETQDTQKIRRFYAETLPQLGWERQEGGKTAKNRDSYIRNGEILILHTEIRKQLKVVHFSLSPDS